MGHLMARLMGWIGHVRYINILTWLRGFQDKIAISESFFCPFYNSLTRRGYKEDTANYRNLSWKPRRHVKIYWNIESGLLRTSSLHKFESNQACACWRIWRKQIKLTRDVVFCSSFRQLSTRLLSFELMYETKLLFSSQGKRIVGATCSADNAQQYLLSTEIHPVNGHLYYYCECYGHYGSGSQSVKCTIHYWECPLTTWSLLMPGERRVLSPNPPKEKQMVTVHLPHYHANLTQFIWLKESQIFANVFLC